MFGGKIYQPEDKPYIIKYDEKSYSKFPKIANVDVKSLKMTNVSVYSMILPERAEYISDLIKERLKTNDLIITDATANVGGNTINFAYNFKKVNAVDIEPLNCKLLKHNLEQYKLLNKVDIICKDYLDIMKDLKQDVVYFDPPWGGKSYHKKNKFNLFLSGIAIVEIINKLKGKAKLVIMYMPFNFDFESFKKDSYFNKIEKIPLYYGKSKMIHGYLLFLS